MIKSGFVFRGKIKRSGKDFTFVATVTKLDDAYTIYGDELELISPIKVKDLSKVEAKLSDFFQNFKEDVPVSKPKKETSPQVAEISSELAEEVPPPNRGVGEKIGGSNKVAKFAYDTIEFPTRVTIRKHLKRFTKKLYDEGYKGIKKFIASFALQGDQQGLVFTDKSRKGVGLYVLGLARNKNGDLQRAMIADPSLQFLRNVLEELAPLISKYSGEKYSEDLLDHEVEELCRELKSSGLFFGAVRPSDIIQ